MMEDFDIIQRNFRFKPDEIFPRIKISLLVSLICESVYLDVFSLPVNNKQEQGENSKLALASSSPSTDE